MVPGGSSRHAVPIRSHARWAASGATLRAVLGPVAMLVAAVAALGLVPPAVDAQTTSPYGVLINGFDHTTPRAEIAAAMQRVKDAGAAWVRSDFWWYSVEWNKGQLDWHYFDYVVEEATLRGLHVIPILWGTPGWAATDRVFSYGVPDMVAWETFVASTVARYKDRITVWEIWNEPDGPWYWRGTPGQYAELLARASVRIKGLDPAALVFVGGLAQGGTGVVGDFLPRILGDPRYPAGAYFDVHNVHTNFRSMTQIASQIANNVSILHSYGLTKPLVVTESSYTSDAIFQGLVGYQDGENGQARYVVDAYKTMLVNGATLAVWASLLDHDGADAYAESGLVRTDASAKPAFFAYQQMSQGGASPVTALVISNVAVRVAGRSATIEWTTNAPADSTVEYATQPTAGTLVTDPTLTTLHAVTLGRLSRRTTYYFRVASQAANGVRVTSGWFSFVAK